MGNAGPMESGGGMNFDGLALESKRIMQGGSEDSVRNLVTGVV